MSIVVLLRGVVVWVALPGGVVGIEALLGRGMVGLITLLNIVLITLLNIVVRIVTLSGKIVGIMTFSGSVVELVAMLEGMVELIALPKGVIEMVGMVALSGGDYDIAERCAENALCRHLRGRCCYKSN